MEYQVIVVCGNKKFKEDVLDKARSFQLAGNQVIISGLFDYPAGIGFDGWIRYARKRKIDMANELFVVNINDYVDDETKEDIEYAAMNGKCIRFLESTKFEFDVNPYLSNENKYDKEVLNSYIVTFYDAKEVYKDVLYKLDNCGEKSINELQQMLSRNVSNLLKEKGLGDGDWKLKNIIDITKADTLTLI